jgi:hypothetical protein
MKKPLLLFLFALCMLAFAGCQLTETTSTTSSTSTTTSTTDSTTTTPTTTSTTTTTTSSVSTTSSTLADIVRNNEIYRGRDISEILGVTHVSGRYYFSSKDFMNEGADQVEALGLKTLKLWFNRTPNTAYNYNSTWPTYQNNATLGTVSNLPEYWDQMEEHRGKPMQSMVDMAKVSYYQDAFSMDRNFTTYVLEASEFVSVNWKNGMTNEEKSSVEREFHDITVYFMQSQKGSGRTFLLQNWEGDNAINIPDISTSEAQDIALMGMADWLNARQDGITRGRNEVLAQDPTNDVKVYGVAEVNQVNDPTAAFPQFRYKTVTEYVLPYTHMDLYSFSTWGTRLPGEEKGLINKLNNIADHAPDSVAFGAKNVMLGEFGAYQSTYDKIENNYPQFFGDSAGGQYMANRKQVEYALEWGVQYMLYWELYCNGFKGDYDCSTPGVCVPHEDGSGQLVAPFNKLVGVWLIDANGDLTPTWYYFNNLVHKQYVLDEMEDDRFVDSITTGVQIENSYSFTSFDNTFFTSGSDRIESIVYRMNETIETASVKFFQMGQNTPAMTLSVSRDGIDYQIVETTLVWSELEEYGVHAGHLVLAESLAEGMKYLRIDLLPNTVSLKVGGVAISAMSESFEDDDFIFAQTSAGWDNQTIEGFAVLRPNGTEEVSSIQIAYDRLNNVRFHLLVKRSSVLESELQNSLSASVKTADGTVVNVVLSILSDTPLANGWRKVVLGNQEPLPSDVDFVELELDGASGDWLALDGYTVENKFVRPIEIAGISQDETYEELNGAVVWYKPLSRDPKFGIGENIAAFDIAKPFVFFHADQSYTITVSRTATEVIVTIVHQSVVQTIKFTNR